MSLFQRPGVRYSETPQPTTPYQKAAQMWDERMGSALAHAYNWRLMAFGLLLISALQTSGLLWMANHSSVEPYVVEVSSQGEVRAVGKAPTSYQPNDAQIAFHLSRFISDVRSLSIDPIVVRNNWLEAYDYATERGSNFLNEYARGNDPFGHIGQQTIAIEMTSVVRASEHSFQLRWIERLYVDGALASTERWTAIATLSIQQPRSEEKLRRNPLGIYVDGLSWNRELSGSSNR